ncbi:MAG: hypothetical protein IIB05_05200 [Bacteroidetes bacterium]|nr:hypothetical protein [Bacteroidota bacterium]
MLYIKFRNKLSEFGVFSTTDIKKYFPDFDHRRLSEWQDKEYIIKIRNSWYCFPEYTRNENSHLLTANLIHIPSYISLETALSWYQIVPEGAFSITSVTTNKPRHYKTPLGDYFYHSIKPSLYFGYTLLAFDVGFGGGSFDTRVSTRQIAVANIEKTILDFLYLRNHYNTEDEIRELRFNPIILRDDLDKDKIYLYLDIFKSTILEKRIKLMFNVYL